MTAGNLNRDGSILFLSCDLQNSTQFKQKSATEDKHPDWIQTFLAFYTEFPALLASQIEGTYQALGGRLALWKAIGDELIFSILIESEKECSDAVDAWLAAMREFEEQYLVLKTPMTLKGGAFLATVPAPDRRVAIPRTVQKPEASQIDAEVANEVTLNGTSSEKSETFSAKFAVDFVGPSIDTGFRVLKYASREYFVLTVEVAHLLFRYYSDHSERNRRAYLVGTHSLKGVWGGKPYPIFAVAREFEQERPSQALAKAFHSSMLVAEEYPSCKPLEALKALQQYRKSDNWQGAIHAPNAHDPSCREHSYAIKVRMDLDNKIDTSEDLLPLTNDKGQEQTASEDLPLD